MANVFPPVSDRIAKLKGGDRETWNFVCKRFESGLIDKSRSMLGTSSSSDKVVAKDLVQETMLKAWKNCDSFRGETTAQFSGWLIAILRNHFLDQCNSLSRNISMITWNRGNPDSAVKPGSDQTPSYHAMNVEESVRLHRGLIQLEPDERRVVELRGFGGLKYREIAEVMGITVSTVANIYQRALKKLNGILGDTPYG